MLWEMKQEKSQTWRVVAVLAVAVLVVDSTVSVVAEVVTAGLAADPEVVAIMAAAIIVIVATDPDTIVAEAEDSVVAIMAAAIIVIVATGVDTIVAEAEDSVVADVVDAEEVEAEFVTNSKTMALALSATAAVTPTT